jgi:hypothetical protein
VNDAYYTEWRNSVKPFLPELKLRSSARMVDNPAFANYLARRERLRERMENPEVSLKLSERVEEILAERELDEIRTSMLPDDENEDDEKEEDPILDEALLVLSDLVELFSSGTLADVQGP